MGQTVSQSSKKRQLAARCTFASSLHKFGLFVKLSATCACARCKFHPRARAYAYTCARAYAYTCARAYAYTCARACACVRARVCARVCACTGACVYVYVGAYVRVSIIELYVVAGGGCLRGR